ncbi:hypothetical protein NHX12_003717 [Muraenolepis orangiensis]|uniref:Uncharacterized protein n=1 Tax=Muraenolepis orangiensis TaxID=630683 RepID=A0A9Q0DWF2_9TELE|nr:hypothetical protein NHX12_003717 [Muraenolepis orangiensis]
MNPVSVGEHHGLRVGSALLCIVAGCIIIGVSRECDADAVGGIFLGAGGLGTQDQLNLERTKSQLNLERTKSRAGTFVDSGTAGEGNPEEGFHRPYFSKDKARANKRQLIISNLPASYDNDCQSRPSNLYSSY